MEQKYGSGLLFVILCLHLVVKLSIPALNVKLNVKFSCNSEHRKQMLSYMLIVLDIKNPAVLHVLCFYII